MEQTQNKQTNKSVIIVLLTVLLLVSLGYIGYDKFINNNSDNEKDKTVESTEIKEDNKVNNIPKLTKDSQEVKDLARIFYVPCDSLNELSTKMYLAYRRSINSKINCSSTNKLLIKDGSSNFVCSSSSRTDYIKFVDENWNIVKNDELEEILKSNYTNIAYKSDFDREMKYLFGKDIKYSYDDIADYTTGCKKMTYDTKLNGYVEYSLLSFGCGGTCIAPDILKDVKQDNEKLTLIFGYDSEESTDTREYNFIWEDDHYIFVDLKINF